MLHRKLSKNVKNIKNKNVKNPISCNKPSAERERVVAQYSGMKCLICSETAGMLQRGNIPSLLSRVRVV